MVLQKMVKVGYGIGQVEMLQFDEMLFQSIFGVAMHHPYISLVVSMTKYCMLLPKHGSQHQYFI